MPPDKRLPYASPTSRTTPRRWRFFAWAAALCAILCGAAWAVSLFRQDEVAIEIGGTMPSAFSAHGRFGVGYSPSGFGLKNARDATQPLPRLWHRARYLGRPSYLPAFVYYRTPTAGSWVVHWSVPTGSFALIASAAAWLDARRRAVSQGRPFHSVPPGSG